MRRGALVLAALVIAWLGTNSAADNSPDLARQVRVLRQQLAAHPDDVDVRMELAFRLAWQNHWDEARRQAREVLARAPGYADAYYLLAELAAWSHDYAGARVLLDDAAARHPPDEDQLLLRADTYIWESRVADARAVLAEIHPKGFDLELLIRQAQVEALDLHASRAHELAGEILAHDAHEARAAQLYDDTRRYFVGLDTYLGRYPVDDPSQRLATGVMATLVVFPFARFSMTGQYEYDHRFGTDNYRASLRADWRPVTTVALTLYARAGSVSVVPAATFYAGIRWEPVAGTSMAGRYTVDVMPWPGQLHRLTVEGGHDLGHRLHADASVTGGLLDYCGQWQPIYGVDGGVSYVRPRWQVGVKLARYIELDRPLLPAFLDGEFGPNVCPAELGTNAPLLDLADVAADDVAVLASLQLDRRSVLSANYTYERLDHLNVNTVGLAIRRSF